ncbi:MAG: hypothetical protein K0Q90_835 [Paenibacillaceae bacterium]|jgi:hypothetical protein|nr:hypothetical protein [Paenibacillaceae bacterium]
MDRIQAISIGVALLFFIQVLWAVRRQRFRERQAFVWLMLAAAAVVTAAVIPLLNRAADKLGIAYMPALIFMLAFYVVMSLLMLHAAQSSREEERLKILTQELGLLRKELEDVKGQLAAGHAASGQQSPGTKQS